MFGFQRLDANRAATEFLGATWKLVVKIAKGMARSSISFGARLSIPLNIAEGSGKFNRDAVRFYTIARGSALECPAILDAHWSHQAVVASKHTTATTSASRATSTSTSTSTSTFGTSDRSLSGNRGEPPGSGSESVA